MKIFISTIIISLFFLSSCNKAGWGDTDCVEEYSSSDTIVLAPYADYQCIVDGFVYQLYSSPAIPPSAYVVWSTGDTAESIYTTEPGEYSFDMYDGSGNLLLSEFFNLMDCGELVFIPNSFEPNGDGTNDIWNPSESFICLDNYWLEVRTKNHQVIFSTRNPNEGWDGRYKEEALPTGQYIYLLRTINYSGERLEYSGMINLLR